MDFDHNDLTTWSTQLLREEFWRNVSIIRRSREQPKDNTDADCSYGEARERLTTVAEILGSRYDEDCLEMDGKPWHYYL